MTVFYVLGGMLAAWALIVTALGVTRHDFPGKGGGERIVAAISIVLVAGAIGSAVLSAEDEGGEEGGAAEASQPAEQPGGGGSELQLAADPTGQLRFDKDSLDARAGKVTITLDNPSPVPHNVSIEGNGVDEEGDTVQKGGKSEVSADLKPGKYTFYCSVPGHRQGGMEGTLTVQ